MDHFNDDDDDDDDGHLICMCVYVDARLHSTVHANYGYKIISSY